ncbi:helix-turn-helix domain-containing protein [Taylorella asinigenitalis]|uniref:helix-turn-helix domain-containing protein n=1 Tax=Taylorella asinigenitalis TaxID=84590 RepID=UPI00041C103E|nr:type II toxin-antitoxin system MqsA family antitoxin [Taylorella asinigenitalis]
MQVKEKIKNWNVDSIVEAVIKDDPDAEQIRESLTRALHEVKAGKFASATRINVPKIISIRHRSGLSQAKFANQLGISVNTLKSWEQGQRNPSGAALKLINLIEKRPELISEL